jgi:hypothetical protein
LVDTSIVQPVMSEMSPEATSTSGREPRAVNVLAQVIVVPAITHAAVGGVAENGWHIVDVSVSIVAFGRVTGVVGIATQTLSTPVPKQSGSVASPGCAEPSCCPSPAVVPSSPVAAMRNEHPVNAIASESHPRRILQPTTRRAPISSVRSLHTV